MTYRYLTALILTSLLGGCKLAVMVSSNGEVISLSDNNNCFGPAVCEIEITDTTFSETFTALPKEGYVFTGWASGNAFQCAESNSPNCEISTTEWAGNTFVETALLKNYFIYLVPEFEYKENYADIVDHLETPTVYDNAPGYPDFFGQTFVSDGKHIVGVAFYAGIDSSPESTEPPLEGPADLMLYDVSDPTNPILLATSRILDSGETATGLVQHDFDNPVPSTSDASYFIGIGSDTGFGIGLRSQTGSTYSDGSEARFDDSLNQVLQHPSGRDVSFLVRGATL